MADRFPSPESQLPLPTATFHILMALADEDRHGYAIIQEIAARTNGEVRLSAGTLYRSIQRMVDQHYVEELRERERAAMFAADRGARTSQNRDDPRRRYYRLTPFGRQVAEAETRRLADLIRLARASGFVPRKIS